MFRISCIFAVTVLACGTAHAGSIGIAIGDFAYVDTSGEATDQVAAHTQQLRGFTAALRRDFQQHGAYHLVPLPCGTSCMDVELPELAHMASGAGADIVVIGGVHKMSTLVQWARVEAIDVAARRIVFDRLFTFRGDNARAWDRAEAFVFGEVQEGLAALGTAAGSGSMNPPRPATGAVSVAVVAPQPIALSVADFQLDDFSAGAVSTGPNAVDAAKLADVTRDVRQLLAGSQRYRLVEQGAAQALVGVISRRGGPAPGLPAAVVNRPV